MLIVGLTGGIASGKSTVARMFEMEGGYLIDTDKLSRELVEPEKPAWQEVVNCFGIKVLNEDRTINRRKLGEIVFSDEVKRKKLEEIIHPKINEEKQSRIQEIAKRDGHAIIIVDTPLLIELNKQKSVDKVILVYASPQVQKERLVKRDGFSIKGAQMRISSQMPMEEKKKYAHYVINNEGHLEKTHVKVKKIFKELKEAENQKHFQGEKET